MRFFIELSYFGKGYHGWQRQPNAVSIQQTLEEALSTLMRNKIELMGAGRTDAGVHAKQLFAHFDFEDAIDCPELKRRLNAFLPEDIAIQQIFEVGVEAHARFDAIARSYEYWLVQDKSPFYKDSAHFIREPLDFEAMNKAAIYLLEHRDFECFSKSNTDVKTYLCNIENAVWRIGDEKAVFHITADRFLRNMVRAIVGTLLEIGLKRKPVEWMQHVLQSKDRSEAGVSVPAKGLYLTQVVYPDSIHI
ncbi:tRNA pseudouridine(38-40) synthase TruA [Muricauda sp. DJ-13]|uniref:tRNA pseudouridine synthase A n=1 Tax=Croceivirga thetidis TaxID=2721623 RepID=A0ABX1GTX8_9FLAO|nr:tRNA pseudouridine(38-40) synthase TruA [Croceivirga thetidis]